MRIVLSTLVLAGLFASTVQAVPLQTLNTTLKDPQLRQQALLNGQERSSFCTNCHGADGNSTRTDIPNLAGQNPAYLFTAFQRFADGSRTDYVMSPLAASLSLDEQIGIALFFSQQKVKPKQPDQPTLAEQGAAKYNSLCINCHGPAALGEDNVPRLAGQPADYIRHSLNLFRSNDPKRAGSEMIPFARILTHQEIDALASYLQGLNP